MGTVHGGTVTCLAPKRRSGPRIILPALNSDRNEMRGGQCRIPAHRVVVVMPMMPTEPRASGPPPRISTGRAARLPAIARLIAACDHPPCRRRRFFLEMEMADWITWNGGECPIHPATIVETRYRSAPDIDKGVRIDWPVRAGRLAWNHDGEDDDIVAYRIDTPASSDRLP